MAGTSEANRLERSHAGQRAFTEASGKKSMSIRTYYGPEAYRELANSKLDAVSLTSQVVRFYSHMICPLYYI
jgi:hypothetical protein